MFTKKQQVRRKNHVHPYLAGNFAPIHRVLPLTPCTYSGRIPQELAGGQYVRNGGNPLTNEDLGRDAHWFDGDGMLSGVSFKRRQTAAATTTMATSSSTNGKRRRSSSISTTETVIEETDDAAVEILPEFVNQYILTDVFLASKAAKALSTPILPSIATLVNPLHTLIHITLTIFRTLILVLLTHLPGSKYAIKKISVANTSILYHDGRALATCESGPPIRIALPGLETVGWFNGKRAEGEQSTEAGSGYGGDGIMQFMNEWTTAHPRVDPKTKELISFHSTFAPPYIHYAVVPETQNRHKKVAPLLQSVRLLNVSVPGVHSAKLMHDFGVSSSHTVIMDVPLSLDPLNLARNKPVVAYDPTSLSRFGVFPRYHPDQVRWFETNPCCIFHSANTWNTTEADLITKEPTPTVNMLVCRLTSASLVFSAGDIAAPVPRHAIPGQYQEEEQCRLYYYEFPLTPNTNENRIANEWALSAITFEFPTLSPEYNMSDAQYIYGCTTSTSSFGAALGRAVKIDFLAKVDVQELIARGKRNPPQQVKGCVDTRTVPEILASASASASSSSSPSEPDPIQIFALPEGHYAQEPRFVPRASAQAEDDGFLLTYVFDETTQLDPLSGECTAQARSELWIIDARNMRDVLAKIQLPQRVPYGLHGNWFSEEDIKHQRPVESVRNLDLVLGDDEEEYDAHAQGEKIVLRKRTGGLAWRGWMGVRERVWKALA